MSFVRPARGGLISLLFQPLTIITFISSSYQVQSDNEDEVGDYVSRVKTWAASGKTLVASVHGQQHAHADADANTHTEADLHMPVHKQAHSHARARTCSHAKVSAHLHL